MTEELLHKREGRRSMIRLYANARQLLRLFAAAWLAGMSPLSVIVGAAMGGIFVAFLVQVPVVVMFLILWICGIKLEWLGDLITDPWRYSAWTAVVWAPVAALYAEVEFNKRAARNFERGRATPT